VETLGGGYGSAEDAALAGWPSAARVRILSVDVRGDRAEIVVDTDPSYPYWIYCVKDPIFGRWRESVSGNGPAEGWDSTSTIFWRE